MRVLFIFIDGLGIGKFNPITNPCSNGQLKLFNNFTLHEQLGEEARKYVVNSHSFHNIINKEIEIYKNLLKNYDF